MHTSKITMGLGACSDQKRSFPLLVSCDVGPVCEMTEIG